MQKKPTDKSSKRGDKGTSSSPYKKAAKKNFKGRKDSEQFPASDSDSFGKKKSAGAPYPKKKYEKKNPLVDAAQREFARAEKDAAMRSRKKLTAKEESTDAPPRKFVKTDKKTGAPYPKKQFQQREELVKGKEVPFDKKLHRPKKKHQDEAEEIYAVEEYNSDEIRLNKYLSHAGVASRRKADELIKEGKVTVNGTVVTEMGYKVKPTDKVEFEGKKLNPEKKYYILLNKPKDFITTVSDERQRKTVMDLIRSAYGQIKGVTRPRLYPVGRLDRNTTGVLLITNDGELAQKLTHPSTEVRKIYHVTLDKKLRREDFDKIAEGGVVLEDGIAEVDEIAYPNPNNKAEVGIEIHTGKNRFVRRIFETLDYEVEKLDRVFFAGLTKKDLPRGRWRFLKEEEVRLLKHFHGSL